jgi:anti-sigma-K factor RskA
MALDITISGTFDMARARQALRKMGDQQAWPNVLTLRSIAAVTALAESLYFSSPDRSSPLRISIQMHQRGGHPVVELRAHTQFDEVSRHCTSVRGQLERASDEFLLERADRGDHLTLRLWRSDVHLAVD